MKDKKDRGALIDSWGTSDSEKKLTKGEKRRLILKPRNKSYVDRFKELEKELVAPVFESEDETIKEAEEREEREEKGEEDEKDESHR